VYTMAREGGATDLLATDAVRMQKTALIAACWLTFLLPASVQAVDFDYPALGAKLTNLPAGAKSLGLNELLNEDLVEIQFGGTTSARISRRDETVSQGNIADDGYRDALFKQLGIQPTGRALPVVLIAGRPAWGTGYVQVFGPLITYQCTFYLVLGGHLYQIAVFAGGKASAARKSFETAAKEITSGLVFEPVQPLPDKPLAAGEMPKFLPAPATTAYYPDYERRIGEQGVVDVEFSIDGRGAAQDLKVTNEANRDFAKRAVGFVSSGGFKIPPGWQQSSASKQSFTMEFRFELHCPATLVPSKLPPEQVITICGSSIPAPR
jgi:hypothetical protein